MPPLQKPLTVSAATNQTVGTTEPFKKKIGTIMGPDGKVLYYVITEFHTVQAAMQSHGHSSITFLNKDRVAVAKYVVDLPGELPKKVLGNALVFDCPNKTGQSSAYKQLIGAALPKWLCAGPNNCFQKQ